MIKYDLEHSGSGPGGMSVAEAIECVFMHLLACCPGYNSMLLSTLALWLSDREMGGLWRE